MKSRNEAGAGERPPVEGVECVHVPAVLVEAAHAVGCAVTEELVQDGHLVHVQVQGLVLVKEVN